MIELAIIARTSQAVKQPLLFRSFVSSSVFSDMILDLIGSAVWFTAGMFWDSTIAAPGASGFFFAQQV